MKKDRLTSYVFVDFGCRDVGGYVEEAKKSVASLKIPEGYRLEWSGEYEYSGENTRASENGNPPHSLIIFVLLYFNTRSAIKTFIVNTSCSPLSLVGCLPGFSIILNYNMTLPYG